MLRSGKNDSTAGMNTLPNDEQIKGAIANMLATRSIQNLTYESVIMLLEASFVCRLASKRNHIKKLLEVSLVQQFLASQAVKPGAIVNTPSSGRPTPADNSRLSIGKLVEERVADINKKSSVDLSSLVEFVIAPEEPRCPASALFQDHAQSGMSCLITQSNRDRSRGNRTAGGGTGKGPGAFWVAGGLYPQVIQVQLSCAVCMDRVVLEGSGVKSLRVDCQGNEESASRDSADWIGRTVHVVQVDQHRDNREAGRRQVTEVQLPSVLTWRILISIEEAYVPFVVLYSIGLYGIPLELFAQGQDA